MKCHCIYKEKNRSFKVTTLYGTLTLNFYLKGYNKIEPSNLNGSLNNRKSYSSAQVQKYVLSVFFCITQLTQDILPTVSINWLK